MSLKLRAIFYMNRLLSFSVPQKKKQPSALPVRNLIRAETTIVGIFVRPSLRRSTRLQTVGPSLHSVATLRETRFRIPVVPYSAADCSALRQFSAPNRHDRHTGSAQASVVPCTRSTSIFSHALDSIHCRRRHYSCHSTGLCGRRASICACSRPFVSIGFCLPTRLRHTCWRQCEQHNDCSFLSVWWCWI